MKDNKYLELLRHYLTEKIDESVEEISNTQAEKVMDIFATAMSCLVSAVLADLISKNPDKLPGGFFALLVLLIAVFYIVKVATIWVFKKIKHHNENESYKDKKLSFSEKKKVIARFDNVACDNLLAVYDSLSMYRNEVTHKGTQPGSTQPGGTQPGGTQPGAPEESGTPEGISNNLKVFYLYEAFYYFKSATDITKRLITYKDDCIDCVGGVSIYRIKNVIDILEDIEKELENIFGCEEFKDYTDLQDELETYKERLKWLTERKKELTSGS